jgi:uncharacterized protein (UPF0335 family)
MTAARVAKDHLKAFVERVQRLNEERKALSDDIRDVYAEAKANGFDVPALKQVIRYLEKDQDKAREQQAIFEVYLEALGTSIATRAPAREELAPKSLSAAATPPDDLAIPDYLRRSP